MPRTDKSFALAFNAAFALAAMLALWVPTLAQPGSAQPGSAQATSSQTVARSSSGLLLSALA